jgi:hypothetical protein
MRIVLVEDDYLQSVWIQKEIQSAFPSADVLVVGTESEFRAKIGDFAQNPPAAIVMDVMLAWAEPGPNIPEPPADFETDGVIGGGRRCRELILSNPRTARIPLLLYTVLDRMDVPREMRDIHVMKQDDSQPLVNRLKMFIRSERQ